MQKVYSSSSRNDSELESLLSPPYRYATLEQDATVISERLESAEGVLGEREGQLVQAREEIQTLTEDLKASQGKVTLQGLVQLYRGFPQYSVKV